MFRQAHGWKSCALGHAVHSPCLSSYCAAGPRLGLDVDGDGTDTGPVLCSGSPSGHRVLVSARCDGVSISTEPSGKTQRKRFVSETSPRQALRAHWTDHIRFSPGDE